MLGKSQLRILWYSTLTPTLSLGTGRGGNVGVCSGVNGGPACVRAGLTGANGGDGLRPITCNMGRFYLAAACAVAILLGGCASSHTVTDTPAIADTTVRSGPITADTHFGAGQLAESQHNMGAAIFQYKAALDINPAHHAALYRLAVVYAKMREYGESIVVWNRYVQATNGAATAYADLGFCYQLAGNVDQAAGAYRAGIAKQSDNVPCRVNYGLLLAHAGHVKEAIAQWQFVLTEAEIHYNLGSVYANQGHKEEARYEFERALQLDPSLDDARTRVAGLDQN